MSLHTIPSSTACLKPGDHYCIVYNTDEEHRRVISDFIREGLERHEKMFYILNARSAVQVKAILEAAGIDVDGLTDSGQLKILASKDAYLRDGEFDPDKMIKILADETDQALREGYSALRATGEMTWALAGEPGSERLIEYESRLNEFFPDRKCYGICQYDGRRFDAELLIDVLHTHPRMLVGTQAVDNRRMYYVPPEKFLNPQRQEAMLSQWLDNLKQTRRVAETHAGSAH